MKLTDNRRILYTSGNAILAESLYEFAWGSSSLGSIKTLKEWTHEYIGIINTVLRKNHWKVDS